MTIGEGGPALGFGGTGGIRSCLTAALGDAGYGGHGC